MITRSPSQAYARAGTPARLGRWVAALLGLALVLGGVGYAAASYFVYDTLSRPPGACHPEAQANTPQEYTLPAAFDQSIARANRMPEPEDVEFRSRDTGVPDLVLRGWWIPARRADAPAVIVVHGIKSCRREPNVLVPAGMLYRHGYSVLLIDLRNHGDSDSDGRFAAGTTEYLDVLGAWDWLVARGIPKPRIGIFAVSFGAGTSVIAGGEETGVAALWADSSWANIEVMLRRYLVEQGYPDWLAPGAILVARLAGQDLTSKNQLDEITRYAGRPVAIIHGEADASIPWTDAVQLRDAAQGAGVDLREFWIVPKAGHTQEVYLQPDEYEARLVRFFDGAIGPGAVAGS